jgi:hypothetical protein
MDYNGDGLQDLFMYNPSGNWRGLKRSNGDGTFTSVFTDQTSLGFTFVIDTVVMPIDYNGDGLQDLFMYNPSGNWRALKRSNGDGTFTNIFTDQTSPGFTFVADTQVLALDYNGDGLQDLFMYNPSGNWRGLKRSNGDGTFTNIFTDQTTFNFTFVRDTKVFAMDYNGDGLHDLFMYNPSGGWRALKRLGAAKGDLLKTVANDIGSTVNITYKPITDKTLYSKGANSAYPAITLQTPLSVVSSVTASSGAGGSLTTTYRYGGLKAEQGTGRGLLGFKWVESKLVEKGMLSYTEFRQDWPYIGMPSVIKKSLPGTGNGGVLSLTTNAFACLDPATGAACVAAAGKRYFPYVSQSAQYGWDLNGAALPTFVTQNEYDTWGNALKVTVLDNQGFSKLTTNTYLPADTAGGKWLLGRLNKATVTSTTP